MDAILSFAAIALPLLWSHAVVPDSVFLHQAFALAGWGLFLMMQQSPTASARTVSPPGRQALGALVACALLIVALAAPSHLPAAAVIAAAVAVLLFAARDPLGSAAACATAWCCAGALCVLIAIVQYFGLPFVSDTLIAASPPGRAVGNLRQPNHLATALACSLVMTAWLWQTGRMRAGAAAALIVAMVLALTLTASRTGAVSLGILVVWAFVDRQLPRYTRWTLVATPLIYAVCWLALSWYAGWHQTSFYGAERLQLQGDISSSRFAIWRNAITLIAQNPWTGVGWGNFNFAWTFTPLPDRPVAFFDHTHNLPLQLAVEIGLPAAAAVLGLLIWAVWRVRDALAGDGSVTPHPARAAFVVLLALGVHSLLEYPLWYAYFLLPAAWALGILAGCVRRAAVPVESSSSFRPQWYVVALRGAGALMVLAAGFGIWDHRRIEAIYAPTAGAPPLGMRIAEGRESPLFGHHADYAAVTNSPRDQRLQSFDRPLHQLVDVRLLIAYIEALRAHGENDKALYAAQRLREFRRDDAQAYFAACTPQNPAPPFQCETKPVTLGWRDLEP